MRRPTHRRGFPIGCGYTLTLLGLLLGCGGNPARQPTAPVTGTVTIDGQPVSQGVVNFLPESGRAGHGKLGPDGSFVISTYGNGDGAVVGKHRIAVDARQQQAAEGGFAEDVAYQSAVPARYANPNTSGLECEVVAGEENVVDLKLSSATGPTP